MKGQKFNLVLEAKPGDFMPIDINILLGNRFPVNFSSLETIDAWTKNFFDFEIMDKIKEVNIVPEKYLNGKLEIINEKKYRYPVMTSLHTLSLDKFININIGKKQVMNKLVNIYQKYETNYLNELKEAIKEQNVNDVLNILNCLTYEKLRNIYMYLDEM